MLKHLEDEGDLNMIIDKDGNLLIVCSKCKTVWHSKFTLALLPGHAGPPGGGTAPLGVTILNPRIVGAPHAFTALQDVLSGQSGEKTVMTAYMEKSDLLKDAGIDMDSIDDLKML